MSDAVLQAALGYAARGWRVFPCHPKTKRPLTEGDWQVAATCDAAVIRSWFARWPSAMIGLPMGDNASAFVLDFDVGGVDPSTGEVFEVAGMQIAIERALGVVLPPTMFATTPSGGAHLYFSAPAGRMPGNARGALPPKAALPVDVRGNGGYVIVPPSRRPDGAVYAWGAGGAEGIAPAPPALLDCLHEAGKWAPGAPAAPTIRERAAAAARASVAGAATSREADEAVRKYADRAMADELRQVEQAGRGERNNQLNASAVKLGRLVGTGVLPESDVMARLEAAAAAAGLVKEDGIKPVRATIRSGLKKGKSDPRDILARLDGVRDRAAARAQRADRPRASGRIAAGPQSSSPRESAPPADDLSAASPSPSSAEGGKPTTLASAAPVELVDDDTFRACAELDKSDTDNAKRLLAYFGHDLLVMAQSGVDYGDWTVWTGTHWDIEGGKPAATQIAQLVGDAIQREADFMAATPGEQKRIDAGEAAKQDLKTLHGELSQDEDEWSAEEHQRAEALQKAIEAGGKARLALLKRQLDRRKHGVATKNAGKLKAMLDMGGPHVRRAPDFFNSDPLLVATRTHTLRFLREVDPENPDEDGTRYTARAIALPYHRREDWNTAVVPVAYDPEAQCPKWLANLERFQPDPAKRRTVQQFAGVGLTGLPTQRLMYHYGTGGNFKSVFLEVLTRVLGESFAVGLPSETISGLAGGQSGSQASPDLARLFGKRMLRVAELPQDAPLKIEVIKKLTGGERFPVRTLFKGFFEFAPIAKPHMSGNGLPRFDGSDGGMRRRLLAVEWPIKLAESEMRDFEEVVRELVAEASGILNWLVAGALDYLANGLVVADDIRSFTESYFDDNDPVGQFNGDCVVDAPGEGVGAREMYHAFAAWCASNGISVKYWTETRFGLVMKKKRKRDDTGRRHTYVDVRLENVPAVPTEGAPPDPGDYGTVSRAERGAADDVVPL